MSLANANIQTTNMQLGPCRVNFKGVDLGGTTGNVTVRVTFEKANIVADQSGTTVRDRRVSGMTIQVETELVETANKSIWKTVFPHAALVGTAPNQQLTFYSNIGDSDLLNAGELILHPLYKADADKSADHKFFKACADATSEYVMSPTDQSKLKIIWNILPDDSVVPNLFYLHGDPSIGLVDATASTPTFVGTGNGTMTGVAVYNGFTKTETIYATCVTKVTNGGVFHVRGSVSGSLGLATVGTAFTAEGNQISFTINDGTIDFELGDEFQVATTAANYV